MEYSIPEDKKLAYEQFLKSAQNIESTIGSTQYRIHKLILMREDIDKGLKVWWEEIIKVLNLDPKKDYMVNGQGIIQDVVKPGEEIKKAEPLTVDDLK